jgi:hypothetical protein
MAVATGVLAAVGSGNGVGEDVGVAGKSAASATSGSMGGTGFDSGWVKKETAVAVGGGGGSAPQAVKLMPSNKVGKVIHKNDLISSLKKCILNEPSQALLHYIHLAPGVKVAEALNFHYRSPPT